MRSFHEYCPYTGDQCPGQHICRTMSTGCVNRHYSLGQLSVPMPLLRYPDPDPEVSHAWDVKEKTRKACDRIFKEEIREIDKVILETADKGLSQYCHESQKITNDVCDKIKAHYEKKGFRISFGSMQSRIYFYWDDAQKPPEPEPLPPPPPPDPFIEKLKELGRELPEPDNRNYDPPAAVFEPEITQPEPKENGFFSRFRTKSTGGR